MTRRAGFGLLGIPVIVLAASPLLALMAGRWGDWTSGKVLAATVSLLAGCAIVARLSPDRYGMRLDKLPWWVPVPALFAGWVALMVYNRGTLSLEACKDAVVPTVLTFLILSAEDMWGSFTDWSHGGLATSPVVPLWAIVLFCLTCSAGLFWLADYTDLAALDALGWVAMVAAIFAHRISPMRL
ncbi:MAG: hypothetical protein HY816_08855 [Candidatus Wallbacteria bacterium]|nr:hypothetical protein [Candidatus Wallbacteria bacterium]